MKFKVNDKVRITANYDSKEFDKHIGKVGKITEISDEGIVVSGVHRDNEGMGDIAWAENELKLVEEAKETMEYKVGDVVEVVSNEGDDSAVVGDIVAGIHVEPAADPKYGQLVKVKTKDGTVYAIFSRRFAKASPSPMSYRDALLHTINGTMTVRHTAMRYGAYLEFDDVVGFNDSWTYHSSNYWNAKVGHWEQYIAKPKFAIDSLVYNADGTIGRVVEDKGLLKGERCYLVKFNAVRDVTKHVKESELILYVL